MKCTLRNLQRGSSVCGKVHCLPLLCVVRSVCSSRCTSVYVDLCHSLIVLVLSGRTCSSSSIQSSCVLHFHLVPPRVLWRMPGFVRRQAGCLKRDFARGRCAPPRLAKAFHVMSCHIMSCHVMSRRITEELPKYDTSTRKKTRCRNNGHHGAEKGHPRFCVATARVSEGEPAGFFSFVFTYRCTQKYKNTNTYLSCFLCSSVGRWVAKLLPPLARGGLRHHFLRMWFSKLTLTCAACCMMVGSAFLTSCWILPGSW